ncbi:MAG: hypothetical protein IJW50_09050 [Clostridia bacterium]|nr:hypothetical protein [Clostridia bacterium]
MAKEKNKKLSAASKYDNETVREMKEDYLNTVYDKEKSLASWKRRERWRGFFGFLMVLSVIAGIAAAIYLWYVNRELPGYEPFINAGIALGAGILLCIVLGLIRLAISASCKKAYVKFNTNTEYADVKLDNLKRAKIDSVLQNQIVIAVRSFFETLVEYEEVAEDEVEDHDNYEYFDADKCGAPELRTFEGSVDSALVYIDGIEVGALDLDSEFSCFRVDPGLHSVKVVIKKEFPGTEKQLVLQTPINPINVDGDYRIIVYTLLSKHAKGKIQYKLKVAEYDDMVLFTREGRPTDNFEQWYKMDEMSYSLLKRAEKLHKQIYGEPETREQAQENERTLFGDETVSMESLSDRIGITYGDARLSRTSKVEVHASLHHHREKPNNDQ